MFFWARKWVKSDLHGGFNNDMYRQFVCGFAIYIWGCGFNEFMCFHPYFGDDSHLLWGRFPSLTRLKSPPRYTLVFILDDLVLKFLLVMSLRSCWESYFRSTQESWGMLPPAVDSVLFSTSVFFLRFQNKQLQRKSDHVGEACRNGSKCLTLCKMGT